MGAPPPAGASVTRTPLGFADLDGWAGDDHAAALAAFHVTSDLLGEAWGPRGAADARAFFEARFRPVLIEDGAPTLLTGYHEPVLDGALLPDARFRVPLHAPPPDGLRPSRAAIEAGALDGLGLELAWVEDPLDAFLMQVQGSGRVRLAGGRTL